MKQANTSSSHPYQAVEHIKLGADDMNQVLAIIHDATKPLVFEGLCEHFPIVQAGLDSSDSAMAYLQRFNADKPIIGYKIASEHQGRVFYNDELTGFNYSAGQAPLAVVLDHLKQEQQTPTGTGIYMGSTDVQQFFPGFAEQNTLQLGGLSPLTNLWLGNQTNVAAHFDFPLNLACNLVGRRRFTLFPPEQIANLYIGPMEFAPGGQPISMVNVEQPDFDKFPKFKLAQAQAQQVELNPGDVLFIPSMWWHQVTGVDDFNVLLTHWWRDTPGFMGRPNNSLMHAMLSLRSLPKAQRQAWKAIFDYYIFNDELDDNQHIPQGAQGMLTTPLDELNARKLRADLSNKLRR
ncbi:cupin-like domain-containing protein [Shewanella maritima]|uniref:Cupin-like domain-containing protein n=1 Tax=Shewanella maritima TaxID=2520507 RepID=A0A411PL49_9GAMM|nr:cupin-like domain-containing protein [Shewanella maritima]QBF84239.1 cupin-like domain-containing protein [Shewanella maritima]